MTGSIGVDRPEFLWLLLLALPLLLMLRGSRRRLGPRRLVLATGARLALLLGIVLALAGLQLRRPVDDLAVVFVLDRSASVGAAGHEQALDFVRSALEHRQKNDLAGAVVFGADALVEQELRDDLELHGVESVPSPHQTDIAGGLRLGTAMLPADRTRRIVLLTDGEQTRGDAAAQVLLTAGDDLELSVVRVGTDAAPEVLLEDLVAPARVDQGAAFDVKVVARSEVDADGTLRLYRNEQYLGEMPVRLKGGRSRVLSFGQGAEEPGLYRYRATFEPADPSVDGLPQNNRVVSTVQVTGRPRVLVVARDEAQVRHLVAVLEGEGLLVEVVGPEGLPPGLSGLRPYAAVALADVAAYRMTRRQQEALRSYVRDLGRGFVMIGGDESFGVGGWYRSAVEEALPVRMDIEDKTRFPKLAMVLAIDKSCSMGGGAGSKLAMAREAAIQTADLLSDRDMLGIIGFDSASSWISPLQDLSDRQTVLDDIASIRPGGGTDIYPALKSSIRALQASDAALKHVILLSDGMTTPGNYQPLIQGARSGDTITLTSVGIGTDADRATMRDFARWGGGSYYLVTDRTSIPAIFTRETLLATRSFLIEEPFTPALADPSELVRGLTAADLPTLHGYVATDPKPRASLPLVVPGEKPLPLLAHWRFGLGRSAAFTSDATTRWSGDWVGTEAYGRMWTQVFRWLAGGAEASNLDVDAEIADGQLRITVDAFDAMGGFRNFLDGEARVVAPDLQVHPLELRQVAPGRYQAELPLDQDGSWMVGVALKDGDEVVGQSLAEAVQPYSPEYRSRGAGQALAEELGRVGGGGMLTDPAIVFARPEVARRVPRPLWPLLIALAGLLLLLDVAVRRLDLSRDPLARAALEAPAGGTPRFQWRTRPAPSAPVVERGSAGEADVVDPADGDGLGSGSPAVEVDPESYAGRLLAARRAARKKLDDDT